MAENPDRLDEILNSPRFKKLSEEITIAAASEWARIFEMGIPAIRETIGKFRKRSEFLTYKNQMQKHSIYPLHNLSHKITKMCFRAIHNNANDVNQWNLLNTRCTNIKKEYQKLLDDLTEKMMDANN